MNKIILGLIPLCLCSCGSKTLVNKYSNVGWSYQRESATYLVGVEDKEYTLNVDQVHYTSKGLLGIHNDFYVYTNDYLLVIYSEYL